MRDTIEYLFPTDFPVLSRKTLQTLQVNLGYLCNQQCQHCHVNAGPKRTEIMSAETIADIIAYLKQSDIKQLDLTGGAPEMNPHFRHLVTAASELGITVLDRCNLSVLLLDDQVGLAEFLADHQVQIMASLPCYLEENVDQQRGKGVFEQSIQALQQLNQLGYGQADSRLQLNLIYNPIGAHLPPPQASLEADYKRILQTYNIQFNHLFTLCNLPIQRFGSLLLSTGQFEDYMQLLKQAHCDQNLDQLMCRSLISIDWQGYLYDCDFNQMLNLPLGTTAMTTDKISSDANAKHKHHVSELATLDLQDPITVGEHCYGCSAGQGSSCGGALQ